jgi:hypothetical protein
MRFEDADTANQLKTSDQSSCVSAALSEVPSSEHGAIFHSGDAGDDGDDTETLKDMGASDLLTEEEVDDGGYPARRAGVLRSDSSGSEVKVNMDGGEYIHNAERDLTFRDCSGFRSYQDSEKEDKTALIIY